MRKALTSFPRSASGYGRSRQVGHSSEILARLNSRAVDLAVMATPKNATNLRVETLFTDEVVLFKDSTSKIDIDALDADAFGELTLITREE